MIYNILGIETSCDETAVAIVNNKKQIVFHEIYSQDHGCYGGVFPEHAARNHLFKLQGIVKRSLNKLPVEEISAVAATAGPGLIGGVIVGTTFAKSLSYALNKPFIAVNHLEGHALVARMENDDINFPFVLLLVSGGHSEILIAHNVGCYTKLSETVDDSVGETFDKVAKMLGLQYPGGAKIEELAALGNKNRFIFPMPLCNKNNMNFSFSGLKTHVHNVIKGLENLTQNDICDIAASLQECISNILLYKLRLALKHIKSLNIKCLDVVISGGVASNKCIRSKLNALVLEGGMRFVAPAVELCTDNGAMIAWAGLERFVLGMTDDLSFEPKARWSL